MRRFSFDMSKAALDQLDEVRQVTGLSMIQLIQHGLTLIRIYVQVKQKGGKIKIENDDGVAYIEMPFKVGG